MAYVEAHQSIVRHAKTKRLKRALRIETPTAVGLALLVQLWAIDLAEDGDLSGVDPADLAEDVGWEGDPQAMWDALKACGWIDPDGHLHNWDKYGGKYIKKRDANRKRQAARRARLLGEDDDTPPATVTRDSRVSHSDIGVSHNQEKTRAEETSSDAKQEQESGGNGTLSAEELDALTDEEQQAYYDRLNEQPLSPISFDSEHDERSPSPVPDDFCPSDKLRSWTREQGWDEKRIEREVVKFRAHHQSNGTTRADWDAAWQKWVFDGIDYDERKKKPGRKQKPTRTPEPMERPAPLIAANWMPGDGHYWCSAEDKGWSRERILQEVEQFRQHHRREGTTSLGNFTDEWLRWLAERPDEPPVVKEPVSAGWEGDPEDLPF